MVMTEATLYNETNKPTETEKREIVDFLFEHLGEYGDPKQDITKAIDYSINEIASFGGFVIVLFEGSSICGVVVVNRTGMSGYVPENILVYIATHKDQRGQGLGGKLMEAAISQAVGDISLHVESDNPAVFLYEKHGFTNPYLEMRLKK